MFFKPKFTITNSMANDLTKIVTVKGFLDAAVLSEDWISEMQNRALVLEAHHTTHIEGTQLTLEQSEQLLNGQTPANTDPQTKAVQHLLLRGELTIKDYGALCIDTPRRTLQRDLKSLVDKGLVKAEGATNQLIYYLVP